ncbi:MAG: O-antigen ligase family protein [Bacteroidota bacterium]|nr:O-antigen ligase family protein [Bacteroidota bacterium]
MAEIFAHGLSSVGQRTERTNTPHVNKTVLFLMTVGIFGVSSLLVLTYGNIFAAAAFALLTVVITLTLFRVEWGFYLFVGFVLLFDQFGIPGFDPITLKASYFLNLKEIPYLPTFNAAVFNPLELHLLFIAVVWFGVICFRKNSHLNHIPSWGTVVVLFLGLIASVVYGLKKGGDFLPALWEVRALFYFGAMYTLVPQIVQTEKDLRMLLWVCIIAISVKAFQAIVRFVHLGLSFRGIATLTNHEDPVFMFTLIVLLFALVLFEVKSGQRLALVFLLLPLLLAFFAGQRRAAYAAVVPTLVAFFVLLPSRQTWAFVKGAFPVLMVIGLYVGILWNSESKLASPVKLIKTALTHDKAEEGDRYYSNLYREQEKYDLAQTVKTSPLIGIGFGNKYLQPIKLVPIAFPLRDYIPHDEVLWLIVKTGAAGYFLFWFFLDCFACNGAGVFMRLQNPYLKAVCALAVVAAVNQIVVSYYDLQLTYYRNMVYLGTLMGLVPALEYIDTAGAAEQAADAEKEHNENLFEGK